MTPQDFKLLRVGEVIKSGLTQVVMTIIGPYDHSTDSYPVASETARRRVFGYDARYLRVMEETSR